MIAQELGIDLGSANTVVVSKRRGIVAREPSVVAVDRRTREVIAVGRQAHQMVGRAPDTILPVRPVQGGVISDMDYSTALLRHMIRRIARSRWLRPRLILTVQSGATTVDKRALAEAAVQAGAGTVQLVEETVAAALGAGLPVDQPVGSMLVDIGSGSTDVAVISLGGVVLSATSPAAGDAMDEAVARYLKKAHNLLIGQPTAERLKVELGAALPGSQDSLSVTGRLLTTGTPAAVIIHAAEVHEALSDLLAQIDSLVISVLERTPPELLADVSQSGITLTGGGAQLKSLAVRLEKVTGLQIMVAEAPMEAVALGTHRLLDSRSRVVLQQIKA